MQPLAVMCYGKYEAAIFVIVQSHRRQFSLGCEIATPPFNGLSTMVKRKG